MDGEGAKWRLHSNESKGERDEIEIYGNQTWYRVLPRDLGRRLMLQQGDSHASGGWAPGDRRPVGLRLTCERRRHGEAHAGASQQPSDSRRHSYGGSVITAAGTDDLVVGLVYIAALAPDADETSQSQQDKFPRTDIFSYVEVADGRAWMLPKGVECFAGDPV